LPYGGGFYLQVTAAKTRSWIFRYALNGRERQMGLGPLYDVSLADARAKTEACRKLKRDGIDPIEARKAERTRARLEAARAITFKDAADAYVKANKAAWRNAKRSSQWDATLKTYVHPACGKLPVQEIDVGLGLKVLEPIWTTKPETAGRVRGRVESI
jgi:hypothetical protein